MAKRVTRVRPTSMLVLCGFLMGCSVLHPRRKPTMKIDPPVIAGIPGGQPGGEIGGVVGGIVSSTPMVIPKVSNLERVRVGYGGGESVQSKHLPKKHKPILQYVYDPLDAELQNVLKTATDGWLKYNPPKEMTEGEPTKISVQLLRPDATGAIQTNPGSLLGEGEVRTSNLKISEEMRITLLSSEADAFDIKEVDSSNQGIQTVLPGGGANWYWDVTPKETGERHLRLIASIVVRSGGNERHQDFATFDTPIKVLVRPKPPISTRLETTLIQLGEENWKWFLGLLPIAEITRRFLQRNKAGRHILALYSHDGSKHDKEPRSEA